MRWDRLSILTDKLADEQASFSYFLETAGGGELSSQKGVFRTNCIDCLDRTNVVQSLIARKNLQEHFEVSFTVTEFCTSCMCGRYGD